MGSKNLLTKLLAVIGTILVWIPLLFMLLFAIARYFQTGQFQMDYLIPAEILPVPMVGALLLLWAALRARMRRAIIGWTLLAAVVLVVGSQVVAVVTGMASGAIEAAGWPYYLTLGGIIAYDVALVVIGIAGIVLIRDVFSPAKVSSIPPPPESTAPNPPVTNPPDARTDSAG